MRDVLDSGFYTSIRPSPSLLDWIRHLVVSCEVPLYPPREEQLPRLLVSPALLTTLDVPVLEEELSASGVLLEADRGGTLDMLDMIDAAGYARVLYLPLPWVARPQLVRLHNFVRYDRSPLPLHIPFEEDCDDLVRLYLDLLSDGLAPLAAFRSASLLCPG